MFSGFLQVKNDVSPHPLSFLAIREQAEGNLRLVPSLEAGECS